MLAAVGCFMLVLVGSATGPFSTADSIRGVEFSELEEGYVDCVLGLLAAGELADAEVVAMFAGGGGGGVGFFAMGGLAVFFGATDTGFTFAAGAGAEDVEAGSGSMVITAVASDAAGFATGLAEIAAAAGDAAGALATSDV